MAVVEKEKEKDIKVYGDVDRDRDGKIRSEWPAWTQTRQIDDLEETVRTKERTLDADAVPPEKKGEFRAMLKREKERLNDILASKPKLDKDEVNKMVKDVEIRIADGLFKRSDMERGIADAHEEARRMSEPCIEIKGDYEAKFAEACNIKVRDGKVSRSEMEKMWKMGKKFLGEQANVERLRKA